MPWLFLNELLIGVIVSFVVSSRRTFSWYKNVQMSTLLLRNHRQRTLKEQQPLRVITTNWIAVVV